MRRLLIAAFVFPVFLGPICRGQSVQVSDDSKPASSNIPGQQYLRIDAQLRATFRIKADREHRAMAGLSMSGMWIPMPMTARNGGAIFISFHSGSSAKTASPMHWRVGRSATR